MQIICTKEIFAWAMNRRWYNSVDRAKFCSLEKLWSHKAENMMMNFLVWKISMWKFFFMFVTLFERRYSVIEKDLDRHLKWIRSTVNKTLAFDVNYMIISFIFCFVFGYNTITLFENVYSCAVPHFTVLKRSTRKNSAP
jgi:hypothetical protein